MIKKFRSLDHHAIQPQGKHREFTDRIGLKTRNPSTDFQATCDEMQLRFSFGLKAISPKSDRSAMNKHFPKMKRADVHENIRDKFKFLVASSLPRVGKMAKISLTLMRDHLCYSHDNCLQPFTNSCMWPMSWQ